MAWTWPGSRIGDLSVLAPVRDGRVSIGVGGDRGAWLARAATTEERAARIVSRGERSQRMSVRELVAQLPVDAGLVIDQGFPDMITVIEPELARAVAEGARFSGDVRSLVESLPTLVTVEEWDRRVRLRRVDVVELRECIHAAAPSRGDVFIYSGGTHSGYLVVLGESDQAAEQRLARCVASRAPRYIVQVRRMDELPRRVRRTVEGSDGS